MIRDSMWEPVSRDVDARGVRASFHDACGPFGRRRGARRREDERWGDAWSTSRDVARARWRRVVGGLNFRARDGDDDARGGEETTTWVWVDARGDVIDYSRRRAGANVGAV